jgi:hypothetical protein
MDYERCWQRGHTQRHDQSLRFCPDNTMTYCKLRHAHSGLPLALAFLVSFATVSARGQVPEGSPSDLIKFLTYQSGRPKETDLLGRFSCRVDEQGFEDRVAAKALVKFGRNAIPAIEEALDKIEKDGYKSGLMLNTHWLMYAYAKIEGPAAFPRLWRMGGNPNLADREVAISDSIALAFGLTAYVPSFAIPSSGTRIPILLGTRITILHCRMPQPRDALNRLILGWERNDRIWMETSLGPSAKAALRSSLEGRTWAEMRSELWPDTPGTNLAVGYRFQVPTQWSVPEMVVDDFGTVWEMNPELEVQFVSKSGSDCGKRRVKFIEAPVKQLFRDLNYLVDSSDLSDLLRVIAACAAEK